MAIRYGIIGAGKRSLCYIEAAKQLPEVFELAGVLVDTKNTAKKYQSEHGFPVTTLESVFLNYEYKFVVIAMETEYLVGEKSVSDLIVRLMKKGIPVLAEMTFATSLENLKEVWDASQRYPGKLQMAEPYKYYPTHYSKIKAVQRGRIGDVHAITMSMAPGASGVCLIRRYLGIDIENAVVYGKRYVYPVTSIASGTVTDKHNTNTDEYSVDGEIINQERLRAVIEFEGGKVAFYDFSNIQSYTKLRTNYMNIQGVRGEINGDTIIHLSRDNHPLKSRFHVNYDTNGGGISKISLEGEVIYSNAFSYNGFTEEEFASVMVLIRMNDYLNTGLEEYSLKEAFYDMRIALAFQQIAQQSGCVEINIKE